MNTNLTDEVLALITNDGSRRELSAKSMTISILEVNYSAFSPKLAGLEGEARLLKATSMVEGVLYKLLAQNKVHRVKEGSPKVWCYKPGEGEQALSLLEQAIIRPLPGRPQLSDALKVETCPFCQGPGPLQFIGRDKKNAEVRCCVQCRPEQENKEGFVPLGTPYVFKFVPNKGAEANCCQYPKCKKQTYLRYLGVEICDLHYHQILVERFGTGVL